MPQVLPLAFHHQDSTQLGREVGWGAGQGGDGGGGGAEREARAWWGQGFVPRSSPGLWTRFLETHAQAGGTACAKILRQPQFLWMDHMGWHRVVETGLRRQQGPDHGGFSKNMVGAGVHLKQSKKPLEDCKQISRMV